MIEKKEIQDEIQDKKIRNYFEDETVEEEYADERIIHVRNSKSLIRIWIDFTNVLADNKVQYRLATKFEDDQMKSSLIEQSKPLLEKLEFVENDLEASFKELKQVAFLTPQEALALPKRLLKILDASNVVEEDDIEAEDNKDEVEE